VNKICTFFFVSASGRLSIGVGLNDLIQEWLHRGPTGGMPMSLEEDDLIDFHSHGFVVKFTNLFPQVLPSVICLVDEAEAIQKRMLQQ